MNLSENKTIILVSIAALAEKTGEEFHKPINDYIEHANPALGIELVAEYFKIVAERVSKDGEGINKMFLDTFINTLENENV